MAFNDLRDWIDDLEEQKRSQARRERKSTGTRRSARSRAKFRASSVRRCYSKISRITKTAFAVVFSPTAPGRESASAALSACPKRRRIARWCRFSKSGFPGRSSR